MKLNLEYPSLQLSSELCGHRASCSVHLCLNTRGYLRCTWFQPSTLRGLNGKNSSAPTILCTVLRTWGEKRKRVVAVVSVVHLREETEPPEKRKSVTVKTDKERVYMPNQISSFLPAQVFPIEPKSHNPLNSEKENACWLLRSQRRPVPTK
jgi:hypothetical protein